MLRVASLGFHAQSLSRQAPTGIPTIRTWLVLLATAVAVPLLVVAAAAIWHDNAGARLRMNVQLQMQARSLALAVDGEFSIAAAVVATLATSSALARGDLVAFRAEMDAASSKIRGAVIGLAGPDGSQVLLTLMPPDVAIKPGMLANTAARYALASGKMEVSDLVVGPISRRPMVAVAVPVPASSFAGTQAISISLPSEILVKVLVSQSLPPGWVAALVDGDNRIVSRSIDAADYVGQLSPARFVAARAHSADVASHINRLDGIASVVAFAEAPMSHYAVAVAAPEADLMAPLYQSLATFLAIGSLFAMSGVIMACLLGRRIVGAMMAIQASAGQVPAKHRFREVDAITERLAASEHWRAVLMEEMNHRVRNTMLTVQSLAAQTLRSTQGDPSRFHREFTDRLMTLARAHTLLFNAVWKNVEVKAMVITALEPWLADHEGVIDVRCDLPIQIGPHQAQVLILGLYELATNAAKHGALSRAGGRVIVQASLSPDGIAQIEWTETGGPEVEGLPTRRGFGSSLLTRVLPLDLGTGASVNVRYERAGVEASIRFRPVVEETASTTP